MRLSKYEEIHKNLEKILNSKWKDLKIMTTEEYNNAQETLYLTGTIANRRQLEAAKQEMDNGEFLRQVLIEK